MINKDYKLFCSHQGQIQQRTQGCSFTGTYYLANLPTTRKILKVLGDWISHLMFKPDVSMITRQEKEDSTICYVEAGFEKVDMESILRLCVLIQTTVAVCVESILRLCVLIQTTVAVCEITRP